MKQPLRIEIEKVNCNPFPDAFRWCILEYNREIALSQNAFTEHDECLQDAQDFKTGPDCIVSGLEKSCFNAAVPIYYGIKKVG